MNDSINSALSSHLSSLMETKHFDLSTRPAALDKRLGDQRLVTFEDCRHFRHRPPPLDVASKLKPIGINTILELSDAKGYQDRG
ncbi:hypothetical protein BLOT_006729 [Blomia tropicalis]|nr:hypothetical protein BLOT_006729 [Blomia tropicalis]